MINLGANYLMMIEPPGEPTVPIDDELTALAVRVSHASLPGDVRYRGFHVCSCGACSDNLEHRLPGGTITNSLLVHYVRLHRPDVPDSEIAKLRAIAAVLFGEGQG